MDEMIEPGRRFRPSGTLNFGVTPPDWEVVSVFTGGDGVPYARLRRVGTTNDVKSISVRTLEDPRFYLAL